MDINFVQVPTMGEVALSMADISYLKVDGMAIMDSAFVDGASVTYLASGGNWPIEAKATATGA